MDYKPNTIDTSSVKLPEKLVYLTEKLAENAHDHWARTRYEQGWTWGTERDATKKHNPDLVPYSELPESEKVLDRNTALETIKAIISLGFTINSD